MISHRRCPNCRAKAAESARAALDVIIDPRSDEADRWVALDVLAEAVEETLMHPEGQLKT